MSIESTFESRFDSRVADLKKEMDAKIAALTANIDLSDPDQVAMATAELEKIFADGKQKIAEIAADEVIRVAVIEPIRQMMVETGVIPEIAG